MPISEQPLVSIGLAAYNSSLRIKRALDALLAQSYGNFELIISDDASSDDTPLICEDYARRDSRIRFIRQPHNLGRKENFRFLALTARGRYTMWASDDDWWDPRYVETLVYALEHSQGYDLAMSSFERIMGKTGALHDKLMLKGDQSTTHQSYARVFNRLVHDELVHIFWNGLWRTEFFQRLLRRSPPDTVKWDRTVMIEAALGTHFYSVEPMLFIKTLQQVSIKVRHKLDPERKLHQRHFRFSRYVLAMLYYILTSRVIPPRRKFLGLGLWLALVWSARKRMFWVAIGDLRKIMKSR